MGFLVHQQGAKLSSTTLCDGWQPLVSAQLAGSAPLRRVMRLSQYVPVCTRLGKLGREEASFLDHMKEDFSYCPLIRQILR